MSFYEILLIVVDLLPLAFIFYLLWSNWQAGSVLLDLGSTRKHTRIILGIMLIGGGIFWLVPEILEPKSKTEISQGLFWLLLGVIILLPVLTHNKIRERGIIYDDRFTKWEQIKSYKWDGFYLILIIKHPFPSFRTRSIRIPSQHKDSVEKLLKQYVHCDINST